MFLEHISKLKKEKVKSWKSACPISELKKKIRTQNIDKRAFKSLFSDRFPKETKVIAEIKKASPSKGELSNNFNPEKLISIYQENGAKAVSVITEGHYFKGSLELLVRLRSQTSLPVLRKDFIVDEYEIYQSKSVSADAMLLIAEMLEKPQIYDYIEIANELDIDVLLEIHSEKSYEKVCDLNNYLLGINNRDLKSLKIDLSTAENLLIKIPSDMPVIIESGIENREHIKRFQKFGVSGFLIGSSIVSNENPEKQLRELINDKD